MGQTYSSNAVDAAIAVITQVTIDSTQSCQTVFSQQEGLTICATDNSDVFIGRVDFTEAIYTDLTCVSTSTVQTNINNNVSQVISQIATAISQAYNIPVGSTEAQNIANAMITVSNDVVETFNNTCSQEIAQNQNVSICAQNGSKVGVGSINFDESIKSTTSCIQKILSTTGVTNQVTQSITQKATAKIDSILGAILFAIILIIGMIILVMFGGFKQITNPLFLIVVAVLIVVYLVIAYYAKIWPFSDNSNPSNENDD